jgi:hypothetical protein
MIRALGSALERRRVRCDQLLVDSSDSLSVSNEGTDSVELERTDSKPSLLDLAIAVDPYSSSSSGGLSNTSKAVLDGLFSNWSDESSGTDEAPITGLSSSPSIDAQSNASLPGGVGGP